MRTIRLAAAAAAISASMGAHAIEISGTLTNFAWSATDLLTGEEIAPIDDGLTWTRAWSYYADVPLDGCCVGPDQTLGPGYALDARASNDHLSVYANITQPDKWFKSVAVKTTEFRTTDEPLIVVPAHTSITFTADVSGFFSEPLGTLTARSLWWYQNAQTAGSGSTVLEGTSKSKLIATYANDSDASVLLLWEVRLEADGHTSPIPEPGSFALMALACTGLYLRRPREGQVVGA